jgi:hypothetical protein
MGIFRGQPQPRMLSCARCIHPYREQTTMKNPLDTLWGTVISGLVLTVVLYFLARSVGG